MVCVQIYYDSPWAREFLCKARERMHISLLSTCRTIYHEATSSFYGNNKFFIV
jgi:hypothetical protein